ncbi:MAG: AbrB/MazE/SpoVT family DNA-binding domain-containing protein [Vicinamibacteria bacterium]|nr:AbrB/MazE/SpoVT family DNA-binding domain-containing protein [Vicinamibacteria bacterium]
MEAQTTVDRFGRVVIPKVTRDHFGLVPGSALTVIDAETGVLLQPTSPTAALRVKGGVLVFQGDITGAADAPVRRERDERIRRFLPGRKR